MPSGLITALRTLTALPIPGKDAQNPATALPWFPIVGLLLGTLLYGAAWATQTLIQPSWPQATALAVIIAATILTRGFHLDGLADCADAFGAVAGKKRALAIMKDTHTGVFAVLALIIVILLKYIALQRLAQHNALFWIIPAYVLSRTMQVELAATTTYARSDPGTGHPFITGAKRAHRIIAHILSLTILIATLTTVVLTGTYVPTLFGSASPGVAAGAAAGADLGAALGAAYLTAWILTRLIRAYANQRIGGTTGDLLGATSEITETAILLLAAAIAANAM